MKKPAVISDNISGVQEVIIMKLDYIFAFFFVFFVRQSKRFT